MANVGASSKEEKPMKHYLAEIITMIVAGLVVALLVRLLNL